MAESRLAERIREEREWLGTTREKVAEMLGVELAAVTAWESGEAEPTGDQVEQLARLFHLPVERLHGAPLVVDPKLSYVCGGKDLTHEDLYEVARFAEYLRHSGPGEGADETAGAAQ